MKKLEITVPCQVGDKAWIISKGENGNNTIYEGKWSRVSLVQDKKGGEFDLRGEVRYEIPDIFGVGTIPYGMCVGQTHTKVGEVVFLTEHDAKEKLKSLN